MPLGAMQGQRQCVGLHCKRSLGSKAVAPVVCQLPGGRPQGRSADGPEGPRAPGSTAGGWAGSWVRRAGHAVQFSILPCSLPISGGGGFMGGSGSSGGGGGGGGSGGGGWGGDGSPSMGPADGANVLADLSLNEARQPTPDMVEEVILLDVSGMMCGGCVGHVKKLLEDQPNVTQASVNLATETALVHVLVPRGGDSPKEHLQKVGEKLADALTKSGYKSVMRSNNSSASSLAKRMADKRAAKEQRMKDATWDLAFAWGLSLLSGFAHIAHAWAGAPAWLHLLHSPPLQAALSVLALIGPGRGIISSGALALMHGRPDMNTLVGLGATASFGVSCVAAMLPKLGWKTFFEEPAMLLGFVLIGRALEERAKLQASADMVALQELVPTRARLVLQTGGYKEVPADVIGSGDLITVLPGDRMPVDGVVLSGRSTVDESAITGEPMPVTKQKGDKVIAGTVNCNGQVTVQAEHSGQQTVIADIVRMVELAQARTAPIQRLADSVAGKFAYGVMGLSAATFAFWALAGTRMFPQVLISATTAGSAAAAACAACLTAGAAAPVTPITATASLILSAQMACNVLVTACPCALGLATPTAVLVGTGAGARRGLLIRGGDVLEAISHVDTVVFDKTGTLTAGKPQVTNVGGFSAAAAQGSINSAPASSSSLPSSPSPRHWSEAELLQLAASVERSTTHPVAQAILRAADGAGLVSARTKGDAAALFGLLDGSFLQEPGSGVSAMLSVSSSESARVSVGTLEWLQRQGASKYSGSATTTSSSSTPSSSSSAPSISSTTSTAPSTTSTPSLTSSSTSSSSSAPSGSAFTSGSSSSSSPSFQASTSGLGASTSYSGGMQGVASSHSRVYIGVGEDVVGFIDVQDAVRLDAASTVRELHQKGLRTVMLSGDNEAAAYEVAAAVGIARGDVYANVKPAGKAALVEKLKSEGCTVAMVGDGINDTAALAAAHVGIAMGGGVDAASEVANVVLMGDQLHQVSDAVDLSRRTMAKIRQNLCWALGYNLVGIPLAAGALLPTMGICLTPSISGAMMGLSSVAVVTNSLLLQLEVRNMRGGDHVHKGGNNSSQKNNYGAGKAGGMGSMTAAAAASTGAVGELGELPFGGPLKCLTKPGSISSE